MTRDTYDMFDPPPRRRFGDGESARPMRDARSDLVDLTLVQHRATERAVLVSETGDEAKAQWLPISLVESVPTGRYEQILVQGRRQQAAVCVVTMPAWLARERGLV